MNIKYLIVYITLLVLINAGLSLNAQVSSTFCGGQKGIKYQTMGKPGSIFHWTAQGGQIMTDPHSNTITVNWDNIPGEYTISVFEETVTGCLGNTSKIQVNIKALPNIDLGKFKGICEGEMLQLNPGNGFNKYLWQDSSTQQVLTVGTGGTYWVEVTNSEGCSFRDTVTVFVNPLPKVDLGKDTILCNNEITLDAGNPGASYLWNNDATTQTILVHEDNKQIWVKVIDENGCASSDTIQILWCAVLHHVNIPNAFTPNGDGHNDFWLIGGYENYPNITVKIYDRWGIQVFQSEKGYDKPWDGTSNGRQLPTDAYFYIINLGDGSKEIVGSITLIR